MKLEAVFLTEKIYVFNWIQSIVAVAGALRKHNGAKSQHYKSPFKF